MIRFSKFSMSHFTGISMRKPRLPPKTPTRYSWKACAYPPYLSLCFDCHSSLYFSGRFNDGRKNKGSTTNDPTNIPNGPPRIRPPDPPDIQEGGFIPMLLGGNRGFRPILPVSTNVTMSHRIKNYEKASINYTAYENPKQHSDYDQLGALTDHSPATPTIPNSHGPPQLSEDPSSLPSNPQKKHDTHELKVGSSDVTFNGPVRRPMATVTPTELPRRKEVETETRNNGTLIDLFNLSSTPASSVVSAPQPTSSSGTMLML